MCFFSRVAISHHMKITFFLSPCRFFLSSFVPLSLLLLCVGYLSSRARQFRSLITGQLTALCLSSPSACALAVASLGNSTE